MQLCRLLFSIVLDSIIIKSVTTGYKVILASLALKALENIGVTVDGFGICCCLCINNRTQAIRNVTKLHQVLLYFQMGLSFHYQLPLNLD